MYFQRCKAAPLIQNRQHVLREEEMGGPFGCVAVQEVFTEHVLFSLSYLNLAAHVRAVMTVS